MPKCICRFQDSYLIQYPCSRKPARVYPTKAYITRALARSKESLLIYEGDEPDLQENCQNNVEWLANTRWPLVQYFLFITPGLEAGTTQNKTKILPEQLQFLHKPLASNGYNPIRLVLTLLAMSDWRFAGSLNLGPEFVVVGYHHLSNPFLNGTCMYRITGNFVPIRWRNLPQTLLVGARYVMKANLGYGLHSRRPQW